MEAGKLDKRIIIQQKSVTRDGYGGETVTWSTFATLWAAIEPLAGREYLEAQQLQDEISLRVRIRYIQGVTPEMRISYGTRTFEILSVIDKLEAGRELVLMCKELQ